MASNARSVALSALLQVANDDAYLNLVLPKKIENARLQTSDAAFATELAYGTARSQGFYDFVIEKVSGRSVEEIDVDVLVLLRLSAHQLLSLETPAHAAIFEMVEIAKKELRQSVAGFVNATLRRISEKSLFEWHQIFDAEGLSEDEFLSIRYSHPIWVTRALKLALQSEGSATDLEEALASDNLNPKVDLVLLPGKTADVADFIETGISPIGFQLERGEPKQLPGFKTGSLRVQDQGSQLAALALSRFRKVSKGESWLDLCAGPGGKAVLLAAEAHETGAELTTNEVSKHRAELVHSALQHSGFRVRELNLDGKAIPKTEKFDRILLDAPCTGLGALRRRPESRWRKNNSDLKDLSKLQRELLDAAWSHLKVDGILGYVTCSPHPTETTAQVEWFLRQNKDAELVDTTATLLEISPNLNLNRNRKTVQLWPHRNGTDAMFIALIQKKRS